MVDLLYFLPEWRVLKPGIINNKLFFAWAFQIPDIDYWPQREDLGNNNIDTAKIIFSFSVEFSFGQINDINISFKQ